MAHTSLHTGVDLSKMDTISENTGNEKSERTRRLREIAREKQDKWRAEKENAARAEE